MSRIGIAMLAVAVLAACGSVGGPADETVGRVTYEVSGGFTGWDRILTVEPDGSTRLQVVRGPSPTGETRQVERATLERLHSLVSDPDFAQLEAAYLPPPGGADLQDYTITVELGGRTIKTMSRDGANPPPILREVLSVLNGILITAAR